MGFTSRMFETRGSLENPQVSLSGADFWDEGLSASGVNVTPRNALQVPAVWAAVNFLSNTFASLPLVLYRRTSDGRERAIDSPLWPILHDAPGPNTTSYAWRKWSMQNQLLRGKSLTQIIRGGDNAPGRGVVRELRPLNPEEWRKIDRGDGGFQYKNDKTFETLESEEVIDVPHMFGGEFGAHESPTKRLQDSLGLAIQLEKFAAKYFEGGGTPPLSLEGPFSSPEGMRRAGKDINQRVAHREGNVLVIPMNHKLNQLGFDPEKSQLEQARRFQIEEVARVFGLPPIFLQDLTRASFANASQQDMFLVKHSLTQLLRAWEQEMNLKIFGRRNRSRFVEFNVDGLLRGEFQTRMQGMATGVQNALLTPNEARAMENRPPMEGGDQLHLQQNMSQLDMLGEEPEPQSPPEQGNEEDES